MPSNKEVKARHDAVMFPCTGNFYGDDAVAIDHGKGSYVTDHDGTQYLDFFGGILTVSIGHAHDRVNAKVKAQMDRLGHVSTLYPALPMIELAEKLVSITPGNLDRVFFTASGTEADETAVALAQTHGKSTELVALRHGYSGRSMLAQSLTAHQAYRGVQTQIPGIKHAAAPYCYRCPFKQKPESCELECAQDIEELIQTTTTGHVAGMLAEPIMGVGGFIVPHADYHKMAAQIIRKYGGVYIADEVQTGFGRTGSKWWGIEQFGVEPDIMTMAKGIANGYPISATLATTAIAETYGKGSISTYGGNPICTAASSAVIETIEEENLLQNVEDRGRELREGLQALQQRFPKVIGDVRGMGLMQAMELVVDETAGDRTPNAQILGRLFTETRERKLLIGKGGLYGNTVRISPAMNITSGEIQDALKIMEDSFEAITKE
jgi:alanine-glyoxylate transaminase / (R)-3-amino-2-methylpropionate-pyruvate transaminase